jgi:hypothetical protein
MDASVQNLALGAATGLRRTQLSATSYNQEEDLRDNKWGSLRGGQRWGCQLSQPA